MEKTIKPFKLIFHMREPVSGLTSLLSACLAVSALVLLVCSSIKYGTLWHTVSCTIYGVSLILLYTSSALYHLLPLGEKGVRRLRRLDHSMIFVLIAGSYTPFCLIPLRGGWGWGLFGVVWGLTVAGIILKTCAAHVPRKITALIYVSMGWLSIFFTEARRRSGFLVCSKTKK